MTSDLREVEIVPKVMKDIETVNLQNQVDFYKKQCEELARRVAEERKLCTKYYSRYCNNSAKLFQTAEELSKYKKYIESKPKREEKYKIWKVRKEDEERRENNITKECEKLGVGCKETYFKCMDAIESARNEMKKRRGDFN